MANRIQKGYNGHMQGTSPDMDKLWDRIEARIDEKQGAQAGSDTPDVKPNITVKRGSFLKYAALAACFIAVIAGTVVFMNSRDNEVKKDTSSNYSYKAEEASAAEVNRDNNNKLAAKTNDAADANEQKRSYDAVSAAEPKIEGADEAVKNSIKSFMTTNEYTSADKEKRAQLVENLAKQMEEKGEISEYQMIKRESFTRIEITLPDGTIQGIILK